MGGIRCHLKTIMKGSGRYHAIRWNVPLPIMVKGFFIGLHQQSLGAQGRDGRPGCPKLRRMGPPTLGYAPLHLQPPRPVQCGQAHGPAKPRQHILGHRHFW
jgi:hypothetical protein